MMYLLRKKKYKRPEAHLSHPTFQREKQLNLIHKESQNQY